MGTNYDMTEIWLDKIRQEFYKATRKFDSFNSTHEGYAVILEELDEMWDEIKANDIMRALEEAVQVAAMALRFLHDMGEH